VPSPDQSSTLLDLLRGRATANPEQICYVFLADGEVESERLCFGLLDARARAIAAGLRVSTEPGARALLLFPPGLDFVAAFFGCLYAGVVAVPAYPPRPRRSPARLQGLLEDAQPAAVLTVGALAAHAGSWSEELPGIRDLAWIAVDELGTEGAEDWRPPTINGDTLAFLQYTSGSTSAPKGVMVSHGNLLHNQKLIQEAFRQTDESVIVSWLPMYHDMGLIGTLLQPLYVGGRCYLMAPAAFLLRPFRWLQAISKYHATTSGGPNFAYDLCVARTSPERRAELDLSSWRVAFNGAEPVRGGTLAGFAEAFASCGFQAESFHPCYGLAEATLLVAASGARLPRRMEVDAAELERNRVSPADGGRELVSCGAAAGGQWVEIVDPESLQPCAPGRVGEIWVSGPSVARGYWEREEPTRQIFQARLAGGSPPFLRTGDLGFFHGGELFVTGRIKDLIILRGRNHYPQDIELTVEASHPALRPGCGAAFAVAEEGEERLVVVHEVERRADVDPAIVAEAVRRAVAEEHEVAVHEVVLLRAGTIPKTTSGKIQRGACRGLYVSGGLEVVARSAASAAAVEEGAAEASGPIGLEALLRREAARLLRLPASRVPLDQPLALLGLDSLTALQMAGRVEEALGVRLPLDLLLADGTLAELAAELLPRLGETPSPAAAPAVAEVAEIIEGPLTHGQSALWFLQRLAPDSSAYHIAAAARLVGGADAPSLRRAFQALTDRHPALRTTFTVVGEVPRQRVAAAAEVDFVEIDGSAWSEEEFTGRLAEEARRPFNLEHGPLLRVALVQGHAEPVVLLTVHHIIGDFWSLAVLLRELGGFAAAFRRGEELSGLVPPAVSPLGWAVREQAWLEGPEGERLWSWWREELAGPLPDLDLPTDRPRPAVQSFRGDVRRRRLGGAVEAVGRAQGATLFATLAAAFQVLLHRMSGQDEILLGAPAAGRTAPELAGTVGYFVNPVVLRADLSADLPFTSHLARVRRRVLGALAHQSFPFPLLAERLQPVRDSGRSPLFQVMLVLHQGAAGDDPALAAFALGEPGARVRTGELELECLPLPESAAQLDLTLTVARSAEGLAVSCQYATDLFDGATIERLLGHFETLLEGIAARPDERVRALPLLSSPEREQVLRAWNATGSAARPGVRLHDLFAAQAERTPEAVALVARGVVLTYAGLAQRAGSLARRLRGLGVGPEVRVGVFLERTADLVVSLLGVLQAGGAYVPLDPAYPAARIALMLEDSGAALVLSQESLASRLPATQAEVLLLNAATEKDGTEESAASPETASGPDNLAYLIYTSGSTGRPKAVAIEHRSAVALAVWAREVFSPEDLAGVLAGTSICFDLSVFELFVPLAWGGRVILLDNALALPTVADQGVTLVNTVPSAIAELVRAGRLPASVRTVSLAGEPLKGSLVRQIHAAGCARVFNLYGPSEDTTYSTYAAIEASGPERSSIGRPIAGTRAYVLDGRMEAVPVQVAGELYLAGEGLARGYLGRPEVTAERFVPDPFSVPGERLYRTGDLARWLPDGSLDFLGRVDHQVKVRGFRIELGEIEAALVQHPSVREAVVLADPEQGRLVGCVVTSEAEGSLAGELRRFLRGSLPEHMVPTAWVWLDALPLTPNGKIDRRALAARGAVVEAGGARESGLASPAEELVAAVWSEVLGIERIGRGDDFFELGGHSLLATRVASRISRAFGVELPVRALFEAPTVAALAERISSLAAAATPAITPVPRDGAIPLSFAQERLWFLHQLEPKSPAYNLPAAMRLSGALDVAALRVGLEEIVARHEALRTRFEQEDGEAVQRIDASAPGLFPVVDLSGLADAEDEICRLMAEEAVRPFDLVCGPLLRATLLRQGGREHVALLTVHHIVSDGWSLDVLTRELAALYRAFAAGQPSPLAALPVQYADFAVWQREQLRGEALERQLAFWRERLAGAPPVLELPADRPRPAVRSGRGGTVPVRLPAELMATLEAFGRRERATLFMVLLAAWETLLARITGQTDLVIGSPIANRRREEIEGLIGFFVNTLALRIGLALQEPWSALIGRVREATLSAYMHQDVPFERLVEELAPGRHLATTPLFQVMLVLQNASREEFRLPGLTFASLEVDSGTAKHDLTLALREDGSGWLEFNRDLFDRSTAVRIAGWFETLATGVAAGAECSRLAFLPLLTEAEQRELLLEQSRTVSDYPREAALHCLFEEQADRTPDAVALSWEGGELTYRELDRKANRLAHPLMSLGVGPEVVVAVLAERSPALIVALLGILKAGGTYAPFDPATPEERLAFLLADTRSPIVLTQEHLADRLPDTAARVIRLAELESAAESDARPDVPVSAEGLAYVMYTSGSTGLPKGVAVVHRAVVRLVRGSAFADFGTGQVWAHLAPASFDASTLEIWAALLHGSRLAVLPPSASTLAGLGEALERQGVTSLWLTAGLFHQMVEENPAGLAPVRQLLAGGDVLSPEHVRAALAGLPGTRVINGYGPTENTTFTCCHPMTSPEEVTAPVSLGRPVANTQVWLLDGELQPVPVGVAGELYAGGDGLARGYLGRPDLTAERFVPAPLGIGEPGSRLYRTGDLARRRPDRTVEFQGRIDQQVKLRGYRVEPGEIEAVLAGHPAVREAAVVAQEEGSGKRLVAFVAGAPELEAASLRRFLEPRLPSWMVPSAFVALKALPLTPNGKVDRRALAACAPEEASGARGAAAAPRTPVEELLAGIWAQVLGCESTGIHDDFFELGGHSLLATRVIARVRSLFRVELPLSALFEAPTVAGLAAAVEASVGEGTAPAPPLVPVPREAGTEDLPLSFSQQRLWFLDQLEPGSPAYNIPAAIRLSGILDVAALAEGLAEIVARHEVLRTRFEQVDGKPVQRIDVSAPGFFPVVDLSGLSDAGDEIRRLTTAEALRPFDLVRGPLLRSMLLRQSAREHVALFIMHHIVSDGWSMDVLVRELAALYEAFAAGQPSPLAALPVQYADFAVWQREWLRGEVLERQLAFWRERLAGAPPVLQLPADRPRPVLRSGRGGTVPMRLPAERIAALTTLGRCERATLFMVLVAAWKTLLVRLTGQTDLVIGSPIANRRRVEIEGLIGFFVNTLALRTGLSLDEPFGALVGRVREVTIAASMHQDLPFERLVEELAPGRYLAATPLFQVMLVLQNASRARLQLSGLALTPLDVHSGTAKLDLTLSLLESGDGVLEYDRDLFDRATAERLLGHFETLLEAVAAAPELPLGELALLGGAEREQVLWAWNATGSAARPGVRLHDLFAAQAERTPEAVALVARGVVLTYAGLAQRAGSLARRLRGLGVGPEVRVGVFLERTADLVVSLLGVLQAGGAYVPLDPAYPAARIALMLEDSGASLVLSQESLVSRLPATQAEVLLLDAAAEKDGTEEDTASPETAVGPDNLAYLIYTSGSTGRPKAVAIEHRSAVALAVWAREVFAPEDLAGVLAGTSICFDLSVFELFVPLAWGGRVIMADNALELPAVADQGVTLVNTVPSAITELVRSGRLPATVRTVSLAGEPLKGSLVRQVLAAGPARVLNLYGPSEDTTYSTFATIEAEGPERSSIGRPIAGTRAYVLDGRMEAVPVQVAGELYLAGEGLARGYLGRPEVTAERFVPDPFGGPGERLYRTGDLARWLPDGSLDFLGRLDHQVKVRGFRIELGEIEAALVQHPSVREAVVLADPEQGRLVGCVVTAEAEGLAGELRTFLRGSLPEHMVPTAWVWLDALPLTPNGKIDRRALAARRATVEAGGVRESGLANPIEELVAAVWSEVLGIERIGRGDDFFELGGHSLLATRVASRISRAFGVELPVRALFEAPTVAALAERISGLAAAATPAIEPVPRDGALPLSFSQERLWFLHQLEPESPAYNMPFAVLMKGSLDVAALAAAIDRIVERHEALRTTFRMTGDGPVQVVAPYLPLCLPRVDLSHLGNDRRQKENLRLAAAESLRPFDLATGFSLRITLLRLAPCEHLLLLTFHHIVSDGWSVGVFLRELVSFYQDPCETLPALPIQSADYAVWQRERLRGALRDGQLAYWRDRLQGPPAPLELPADRARPAVRTFRGGSVETRLSPGLTAELKSLARRGGATLFMVLLAAVNVLLQRLSGQDDVVVGSPIADRSRVETEPLIGCFLNTLALRTDLSANPSVQDLLARVRETCLGAYLHRDIPFEAVLEDLQPVRDLSRTPLFQVFLNLLNLPAAALRLPGLTLEPLAVAETPNKLDMSFYISETTAEEVRFELVYNADLFDAARMSELLGQLAGLLTQLAERPQACLGDLSLLTAQARALLPDPAEPLDAGWLGAVHELFSQRARIAPERTAVVDCDGVWTYGRLEAESDRLAAWLAAHGVAKGDRVAISAQRSAPLVQAVLGALKAGAAFVMLDPSYPPLRLVEMLRLAEPRALVCLEAAGRLPEAVEAWLSAVDCARIELPCRGASPKLAAVAVAPPSIAIGPDDAAVLGFTSGSTGTPKGIVGRHGPLSHFLPWQCERFGFGGEDHFSQLSGLAHDPLQRDLFTPLYLGATICIPDPADFGISGRLAAWMARQGVTVAHLTPAMAQLLTEPSADGEEMTVPTLRRVLLVGESLTRSDVARIRRLAPGVTCVNLYGSTETQRAVSFHVVEPDVAQRERVRQVLPLGRGMQDVQLLVLDRSGRLAGVGELGEIAVRSPHLAQGYLGDAALTAEKFRINPFTGAPGDRIYRTGDLGRYLPDGEVEFAGRVDFQVKIRGFRIELGEIEAVLASLPRVREAVVLAREERGERRLVAYAVPEQQHPVGTDELRKDLEERLPAYMVPTAFVLLDRLPLTPNGKVDRKSLSRIAPAPPAVSEGEEGAPAPFQDLAAEILAGIWAEVLGVEHVGPGDDFFALGGHSLAATRVVSRIQQALGVTLPVRRLFERRTVRDLAALVREARIEAALGRTDGLQPPLVRVGRDRLCPLSFAQERLWFLDRLQPGSAAYNIPCALELDGRLAIGALVQSLCEIVRRHEALRSTFRDMDGQPVQVIAPDRRLDLAMIDLSGMPAEIRAAEARRLREEEARRPLLLDRDPLLRVRLYGLAGDEHQVSLTFHHIVSDGWSIGVFVRELGTLYAAYASGRPSPLPELPIQYADFAHWQRQWLAGATLEAELEYWRERLKGMPPVLELQTDRPRPAVRIGRGAVRPLVLRRGLAQSLATLGYSRSATLFLVLLAAYQTLLLRSSGQEDLAIGTPVAGRRHLKTEPLIGLFINTLVLRADLSADPTFSDLLARVREAVLGDFVHADVPFEKVVEALQPRRDLSHTPLVQVFFQLQSALVGKLELPGLSLKPLPTDTGVAKFDLTLTLEEREGALFGALSYDRDLFEAITIDRLGSHFANLLEAVAANPERRLSEVPVLSLSEHHQLLREWSDTAEAMSGGPCVHRWIEEQVRRTPDAVALELGERCWSYRALDAAANRLARHLRAQGVGPERIVAVCLERSAEMVIAVLAVMKAGGVYLPLDPAHPRERLAAILEDAGSPLLLAQDHLLADLPQGWGSAVRLEADCELVARQSDQALAGGDEEEEALAYVIFTSGSTGRPKGVQVPRRGLANFLGTMRGRALLTAQDVLVAVTTLAFDIAGLELFLPLITGARLVIAGREAAGDGARLAELLAASGATVLQATPATWRQLLEAGWRPPGGFRALCGGEALSVALAGRLLQEGADLWNLYGPTETTIWSAIEPVSPSASSVVPLGRPLGNTGIHLLDPRWQPVEIGAPGEVCIGGAGVARGYLRRPELTAERFVPDPFAGELGARLYRTGDLARRLPDGRIEFLGRLDHQVKIRGFRIELGEIEGALLQHPALRQAVVMARQDQGDDPRLVAYVVAEGAAPTVSELRRFLRRRLPEYMIPAAVVVLERMPLNASGKVDRRALPAPSGDRPEQESAYEPPRSDLEVTIAGIWRELLGIGRVGVNDNFFDLGGHSLLLLRLRGKLREHCEVELEVLELFEHPTVRALARRLAEPRRAAARESRVETGRAVQVSQGKERMQQRLALRRSALLEV